MADTDTAVIETPPVETPAPEKPAETPSPEKPAAPETLITKEMPDTGGTGADGAPPPTEQPAGPPDKYELTLPEGSTLDPAVLERTAAIARERGLSNEQAQAAVNLVHQEAEAQRAAVIEAHKPGGGEWEKQKTAWEAQALADEELGNGSPDTLKENLAHAHRALDRFSNPGVKDFLLKTGLGSHPEAIRLLTRIGKAMGEGSLVIQGASSGGRLSDADVFFSTPITNKSE